MKLILCWLVILAAVSQSLSMRGALFRSGRSAPFQTVRGMENARGFVTQDFLRFGRRLPSTAGGGYSSSFGDDDREDFLPHARFPRSFGGTAIIRNPLEYGFIV